MKIFFDNVNWSSSSGPNTFAYRLAHQLSLNGHIIADINDFDVTLVFIEPTQNIFHGKPVIQRLDGIWFKNQEEFETKNAGIKWLYKNANHVVWQSDFDKNMTLHHWGNPQNGTVVHNGMSLQKVYNTRQTFAELKQRYEKVFVCSANWHPQKRLKDNIELFKHIRATMFPYSCLIVTGANPDCQVADANIYYTGSMPHEICLELYSIADWMIHLGWCDHCPNVVVEALSQGCPVICAASGGTKEIVGSNGVVLAEVSEYQFQLYDYDNPPKIDVTQLKLLPAVSVNATTIDIKLAAQRYEEIFAKYA